MKDFKRGEGPHGQGDGIIGGVAMSSLKKYALIAACTTAVAAFAQTFQAATWSIVGGGGPFVFAGYGTAPAQNNVVNNPPSMVTDATGGATWVQNAQLNALFSTTSYGVNWFYVGSESDRVD